MPAPIPSSFSSRPRWLVHFVACIFALSCVATPCFAGASACHWVVVVNGDSLASRTIANYYCQARNIPSRNVVVLHKIPDQDKITVDQFRELILEPLLKEIENRNLIRHIQGVAYSADFPTAVDLHSDLQAIPDRSPYLTPVGSINALTYLFRLVMAKNPGYVGFDANFYAAGPASRLMRLVGLDSKQVEEINKLISNKQNEEAAKRLDTVIDSLPQSCIFPMQYLSAQQWALADQPETALKRIEQSIRNGWSYREFLLNDPAFASLKDNKDFQRYALRCQENAFDYSPTRGFEARAFYTPNSLFSNDPKFGTTYLLSTVLAVTRDLGITQTEAIHNLKTSVKADYSFPKGAFLFTKTSDVRTKAREPSFEIAIRELKELGYDARVVEGVLPKSGEVCAGVMLGTPTFSWQPSGCRLLPGALADNLTSFGGAMTSPGQTKATEFLRCGAAMCCGTVTEPYSIPNKFPHPMMHVHYVEGLTAAEAFYSSISCPYQQLIVGDPLCQPYARAPQFSTESPSDRWDSLVPYSVQLKPKADDKTSEPETLQWIVDGVLQGQAAFDTNVRVQVRDVEPGAHELRFVAKSASPLETCFEQTVWTETGRVPLVVQGPEQWTLGQDKPLKIRISGQDKSREVEILHEQESIGKILPNETEFEVPLHKTGHGPVRLHATQSNAKKQTIRSKPITILLEP